MQDQDLAMRKLIVFFVRTLLCFVFYVFARDLAACLYMWNKSSSDDLKKVLNIKI